MTVFDEATLTLENDRRFYEQYICTTTNYARVAIIRNTMARLLPKRMCSEVLVDGLVSYFDNRYHDQMKYAARTGPENSHPQWCPSAKAYIPTQEQFQQQLNKAQEKTMSTIAFFQNKQFINGQDISTLSKAQIYQAIANKEAELAKLNQIENKPKSLVKEIEQGKADIKALVAFLDAKEAA